MAFWLMKSEPDVFGWHDLQARGASGEAWDGVRNYQARNNMRAMAVGDLAFFYHSRSELAVVGVAEIIAPAHPDPTTDDPRWECVDIAARVALPQPVTLVQIKDDARLADMVLVRNSRLSVQPVTAEEWRIVCGMGGLDASNI
jgi:predicted RNA-binding protein with PUA-like domain